MSLILNLRAAKAALNTIKAPCVSPTASAVEAARKASPKDISPKDYRSIVLRDYADYQDYKKRKSVAAELVAKLQQQIANTPVFDAAPTKAKIKQCRLELAALAKPPKLDRFNQNAVKHRHASVAMNIVPNRSDVGDEHLAQFDYITEQYRLQTEYDQARQALNKRIAELNHSLLPSDLE